LPIAQFTGSSGIVDGLFSVPVLFVSAGCTNPSPTVEGSYRLWIEPDRLGVVPYRFVEIALSLPGKATVDVGQDILRIEPQGFVEVVNRFVKFALAVPNETSSEVGRRLL